MFALPATLPLGARCDVQTGVVTALVAVGWELAALLWPLRAVPLMVLARAGLAPIYRPAG